MGSIPLMTVQYLSSYDSLQTFCACAILRVMSDTPTLLSQEVVETFLTAHDGWEFESGERLVRQFWFVDFSDALAFVNKVGDLAVKHDHHPDILLHDWNKVTIRLFTHEVGGISNKDIALAGQINNLLEG